jgi:hypothetical protein
MIKSSAWPQLKANFFSPGVKLGALSNEKLPCVYIFVNHQHQNKYTASGVKIRKQKLQFQSLEENTYRTIPWITIHDNHICLHDSSIFIPPTDVSLTHTNFSPFRSFLCTTVSIRKAGWNRRLFNIFDKEFTNRHCRLSTVDWYIKVALSAFHCHVEFKFVTDNVVLSIRKYTGIVGLLLLCPALSITCWECPALSIRWWECLIAQLCLKDAGSAWVPSSVCKMLRVRECPALSIRWWECLIAQLCLKDAGSAW